MKQTRLISVFSDHAVLQQQKPITLRGLSAPLSDIRAELCGKGHEVSQCTLASEDGCFRMQLPAMDAGGPYELFLWENEKQVQHLSDIMIGEVWLCGGQSNMEYELQNDADAKPFFTVKHSGSHNDAPLKGSVASSADPFCEETSACPSELSCNVRFYQVPRQAYFEEQFEETEEKSRWMTTEDPLLGTWSAVAYYYAKELSEKLGCTVGLIGCNWGGTSASAWQSKESLLSHSETAVYQEEYDTLLRSQDPEEYEKKRLDYLEYQKNWQPKMDEFYAAHPKGTWDEALAYAGPCLWPGPMGPKHEFRPAGLYETMLKRVAPYTLRGFLYYQGESDDHRPASYKVLLEAMIREWRTLFEDPSLTFLNVQLPMHRYANDAPSDSWAVIREAQEAVWKNDKNSGLAVIIDQGEYDNIHPLHKKEVGHRLFLQSMLHPYHMLSAEDACGPMLKTASYCPDDHSVILCFENIASGFDTVRYRETLDALKDRPKEGPDALHLFTIAGNGHPEFSDVTPIFSKNERSIRLPLPESAGPEITVRYLWDNYSIVPLFDKRGFPLAPFQITVPVSSRT